MRRDARPMRVDNTETQKARSVRDMFGSIATKYDFLNHLLSGNIDRRWRRTCVRVISRRIAVPAPRVLDVGCGTADLSIAFSSLGPVFASDFCQPMLHVGKEKIERAGPRHAIALIEADALNLPFRSGVFDVVASAFVVRNLANIELGLQEMRRVLRPGGILGILDFSMPRMPVVGAAYRFYFLKILPRIGKWLSGVDGPYRYLPDSVQTFSAPKDLCDRIAGCGFREVESHLLTQGIAVLFVATAA